MAFHGKQVDDALEAALGTDGELNGQAFVTEPGLDFGHRPGEIGVLPVHFIDEDKAGEISFVAVIPGLLGADFDAGGGADDDDGAFSDAHRCLDLADEIGVAGSIDDVYLFVLPLAGEQGQVDADLALYFVGVVIGSARAIVDLAQSFDCPGGKKDGFRGGGLAGAGVGEEGDVPDVFQSVLFHLITHFYRIFGTIIRRREWGRKWGMGRVSGGVVCGRGR